MPKIRIAAVWFYTYPGGWLGCAAYVIAQAVVGGWHRSGNKAKLRRVVAKTLYFSLSHLNQVNVFPIPIVTFDPQDLVLSLVKCNVVSPGDRHSLNRSPVPDISSGKQQKS